MTNHGLAQGLADTEAALQEYLAARPPPFFIIRQLSLKNVPGDRRLDLLQDIFPTVKNPGLPAAALVDGANFSQRDDIACLNRFFFENALAQLEAAIERCRILFAQAEPEESQDSFHEVTELLGYLLVERIYWEFITQPLVALRLDRALIAEARRLLSSAVQPTKEHRDWLRLHRVNANLARLGYLNQEKSQQLTIAFDTAISMGQFCLDHGYPLDPAFYARRDELLHMAGIVKFVQRDINYPNLAAHIKSPAKIKPQPGGVRLTLEDGKLIGNVSPPLTVAMRDVILDGSEDAAFIDLLCLEDRVQVWTLYRGKYFVDAVSFRELHAQDSLDLIFRPSQFEVTFRSSTEFGTNGNASGARATQAGAKVRETDETVALMNLDSSGEGFSSNVIDGRTWQMRSPVLKLGFETNDQRYHNLVHPKLVGMHWERLLGPFLHRIIPDSSDLKHIVISTDGPLSLLPLHLATLPDGQLLRDRYRISYTPTLARFGPASAASQSESPRVAFLINSRNRLQGPIWELERMLERFGKDSIVVLDQFAKGATALQEELKPCDIVHIATHGYSFTDTPDESGIDLGSGRTLTIREIEKLSLKDDCLVFLNACGSHRVLIQSRIQFSSIANAFIAAGAATVIATFWETDDVAAALISDQFYKHFVDEKKGRLECLENAIAWVRQMNLKDLEKRKLGKLQLYLPMQDAQPYAKPDYWGQFSLFGRW